MDKLIGIVLNAVDYSEKAKIVNIFTNKGKISVRCNNATSIKSLNLSFCQPSNLVSFIVNEKNNYYSLKEYNLEKSYFKYTEDFNKIEALMKIIKLLNYLPQDINFEKVLNYTIETLDNINNYNPKKVLSIYLVKMLYTLSINPNLKECSKCKKSTNLGLNFIDFTTSCINCNPNCDIKLYQVIREYYYKKDKIDNYIEYDYNKLLKYLYDYYNRYSGIKIY